MGERWSGSERDVAKPVGGEDPAYAEGFGAGYSQAITDVVHYFQQQAIDRDVLLRAIAALIADLRADRERKLGTIADRLTQLLL